MIFDIYEQADLFRIAKCGRQTTLERWLRDNRIPFNYNAQGKQHGWTWQDPRGAPHQPAQSEGNVIAPTPPSEDTP